MRRKIISIIMCTFLVSCCISKKFVDYGTADISFFVKDYYKEYSSTDETLFAILIKRNNQQNITIVDLPEKAALNYLQESKEGNYDVGMYSNILCFYRKDEIKNQKQFFSEVPLKLYQKATEKDTLIINGKEILLSNKSIEWNSSLEIVYSLTKNEKVINDARSADNNDLYLVEKIEKKNSWYVIYIVKQDTLYKVVSKADNSLSNNCKIINVGKRYNFDLKSHKENTPTINNVKLDPVGYTGCYQFDEKTSICLEPENGIFDLFLTENLKGICYIK